MRDQIQRLGSLYDWNKEVAAHDKNYYKWTQYLFIQLFNNGLAYKEDAPVNWCTSCNTVLACLLYTSPSPRDCDRSRMPSSA